MISVELEITLRCNHACPSCSRHCNIFDYGPTDMSMLEIEKFVKEAQASKGVKILSVMGGEPTIHPRFVDIVELLHQDLVKPGVVGLLRIATNGKKPLPRLSFKPATVVSLPSQKKHRYSFIAPQDSGQATLNCRVPYTCGVALNKFGYSPCGAGGAVARLFGLGQFIRDRLPSSPEEFIDYRNLLCTLCQASAMKPKMSHRDRTPSRSYLKILEKRGWLGRL